MVFTEVTDEEIIVVRTLECDLCMRFDSVMITKEEISRRVNSNALQIGSHLIPHGDHLRIVYFDHFGMYLGDTISLNTTKTQIEEFGRKIPVLPEKPQSKFQKLRKYMLQKFMLTSQSLCIVGPSFAGKTSLTMYLETGLAERYSKRINHSPTLGKSVRRFNLGKSKLMVFDMGGQRDFWDGWFDAIDKSAKIMFVLDGTANNISEIKDALIHVIKGRASKSIPMLVLINKMDLLIDGYTNNFTDSSDFIASIEEKHLENVWMLETSVFNGICYNYGTQRTETPLAKVISAFLE
ncbi:MAG: ADP-ribosylation factor-like protein [Candidatus Kariarchaeaceae archaeon]|jgi:GTPase SAR1 family protein